MVSDDLTAEISRIEDEQSKTGPDGIDPDDLPISTTEHVLGATVTIHSQWVYREMHGMHNPSGFSEGIRVDSVGERALIDSRERRYIAAWARRNLFDGVGPRD